MALYSTFVITPPPMEYSILFSSLQSTYNLQSITYNL